MFGKLFTKKEFIERCVPDQGLTKDYLNLAFESLVLTYLEINGIDEFGNKSKPKTPDTAEIEWIQQTLEDSGFTENIEQVILKEWDERKFKNNDLTPIFFKEEFLNEFHNRKIEDFVSDLVQERNIKLKETYRVIISMIERLQRALDDDELKTRIESNFGNSASCKSTILQCTTLFCIISLGCDQMGRYNIVYSIDHGILKMISESLANTLIRRIYQLIPEDLESSVHIGSLNQDCVAVFNKLNEEAKTEHYHKIITIK